LGRNFLQSNQKSWAERGFLTRFQPFSKNLNGVALPLFVQSEGEYTDIELYDEINPMS
jgi:hypothetical protein